MFDKILKTSRIVHVVVEVIKFDQLPCIEACLFVAVLTQTTERHQSQYALSEIALETIHVILEEGECLFCAPDIVLTLRLIVYLARGVSLGAGSKACQHEPYIYNKV